MSQEDRWEQRRRAIEQGQRAGGPAGGLAAEKAFNAGERGWTHIRGSVEMTKQRAKGTGDIVCGNKKSSCPKHPEGHRYRGKNKCWGCGHATWYSTGKPYR